MNNTLEVQLQRAIDRARYYERAYEEMHYRYEEVLVNHGRTLAQQDILVQKNHTQAERLKQLQDKIEQYKAELDQVVQQCSALQSFSDAVRNTKI